MSELGELYSAWNEHKRAKKKLNYEQSLQLLADNGVVLKQLSPDHFRIDDFDYWPSTGLFINRKTNKRGRGVFNLIKRLQREQNTPTGEGVGE